MRAKQIRSSHAICSGHKIEWKRLIIKAFENTFFCFENFTFGTSPGIRDIFPCGSSRDTILWIAFYWIIDIMTFKTDPAGKFFIVRQDTFNSKNTEIYSFLCSVFSYECSSQGNDTNVALPSGGYRKAAGTKAGYPERFRDLSLQRKIPAQPGCIVRIDSP